AAIGGATQPHGAGARYARGRPGAHACRGAARAAARRGRSADGRLGPGHAAQALEPPWTEDEIATLRRDYGKVPTSQLDASLGRKKSGVFNKAFTLGLVHGYHRPFNDDEKTAIRIAHDVGLSLTDLSAALDRDLAVVSKHAIRHLGLSFRARANKAPRGKRALRPDLTLADILQLGDKRQEAP
ncbi:MAG TPA: hypothetical protein VJY39_21260, partial [Acidisphaera sp.]|nr:hypothetical protein [Acidisphaera sp.]